MASGKTHDKITVIMAPFVAITIFLINFSATNELTSSIIFTFLSLVAYLFGGYMFSGDIDIKSRETNRWGNFKFIWTLYQKSFSHRSIFTHGFILGPVIRLLYIYGIYLMVCAWLYSLDLISLSTKEIIKSTYILIGEHKQISFNIMFALFLGSGLHTITDLIYSFVKKIFKGKKRGRKYKKNKRASRKRIA